MLEFCMIPYLSKRGQCFGFICKYVIYIFCQKFTTITYARVISQEFSRLIKYLISWVFPFH